MRAMTMLTDPTEMAMIVRDFIAERIPQAEAVPFGAEPNGFHVEVRSDANGGVDAEAHLRPAAMALANLLDARGIKAFGVCDDLNMAAVSYGKAEGPVPVRVVKMLQVLPDPIYKHDDNGNLVRDDDGEPIWDDEAMSLQVVPFWRVRIDVLGYEEQRDEEIR